MVRFIEWLTGRLQPEDRLELLEDMLSIMDMDEQADLVMAVEAKLKAANYDWKVFREEV